MTPQEPRSGFLSVFHGSNVPTPTRKRQGPFWSQSAWLAAALAALALGVAA